MWLAALQDQGDYSFLRLLLIGWLTHLLEFWDEFIRWSCNRCPPHICNFLEGGFSVNILGLRSHCCFWFHQVWLLLTPTLILIRFFRTGSNLPCLTAFGFPDIGSRVGVWMAISRISFILLCIAGRFFLIECSWVVYFLVGDRVCPIFWAECCRGTCLVQRQCSWFNAWFFEFNPWI